MREIKFRAWDKVKKVMRDNVSTGTVDIWGGELDFDNDSEAKDCDFMQYTGLKDKNGKEIYESDIIQINDWNGATGEHIGEVYWCDGYLCWSAQWLPKQSGADSLRYIKKMLKKTGEAPSDDLGNLRWPQVEVIGNIYENPDLLK